MKRRDKWWRTRNGLLWGIERDEFSPEITRDVQVKFVEAGRRLRLRCQLHRQHPREWRLMLLRDNRIVLEREPFNGEVYP